MYLKEIKSHGFKSFADKVKIELTPGITGIVGPNGSGKSNVVDAVRWVLGEQSVKSLRGDGNMTDVIFSGSKSRNPLNVASVTLVFDNQDHYLPIEFDEVSIQRRVYKDGTNEYYINKERCRLKDISDLLLDSGIAKESFNVISQGKIEEILASKPVERRTIFEEAAGVLKYKKRKEEALRKLERTHENMSRVDDIIRELEVQVEPLKDQKEKALQYLSTKEELEQIEVALLAHDITTLHTQYEVNKRKIDGINQEIMSLSTSHSTEEAKIETYKLEISKLDQLLKDGQANLLQKTTEVEKLNSQKQIILERKKYEVEDTKLHANLVHLKEQQLKFENDCSAIQRELKAYGLKYQEQAEKFQKGQIELQNLKKKKNDLQDELSKLIRLQENKKGQVDYLKESIEHNSLLPTAVKSVLNHPTLPGIHHVIGNILEMEDQYRIAISTSLGMSASNIIVDDEQAAKVAIQYLKTNHIGRATFFPLNIISPRGVDLETLGVLEKIDGYVGIASHLVQYDKQYQNIVLNQLGNVLVAADLDSANVISKKIHYRYKIVTLDGELLHIGGSLTGGNQSKTRTVITEKQELEVALQQMDKLMLQIAELENRMNEIDYQYKSVEDSTYLANKERIQLAEMIETKKAMLITIEEQLEQLKNEFVGTNHLLAHSLSEEEDKVIATYYQALKEKDELASFVEATSQKRNDYQEELSEYEYHLKKENSAFQEKNRLLKELEIENNRIEVKLDHFLIQLSESYNLTYEKAKGTYQLELDEDFARNKVSTLKKILKELGIVNLAAPEEYDRISTRYEFLLAQRDDLVQAENILLQIIDEMDQVMKQEFLKTFSVIEQNFETTFQELFKGGHAELCLTDPENLLETGIEIIASPPGKKLTSISLLSGGEKTFTAISLLFAILKSRPVPFCILDEVEAALDEVNVDSFGSYLLSLKNQTQFILITHKKKTMEYADVLYGITMQESGVSKLVSVKLEEIK